MPLIFVPGITGSELRDLQGSEKWPRADEVYQDTEGDHFLLDIGLNEDGSEIVETEPGDILRSLPVNNAPDPNIYATTISTLTDYGYVEDEDLFVFPFDWRKDVEGQGKNELIAKINQILDETGASRVDIMAHSQGGLKYIHVISAGFFEPMTERIRHGSRLCRSKKPYAAATSASTFGNSSQWVTSLRKCRQSISMGFNQGL